MSIAPLGQSSTASSRAGPGLGHYGAEEAALLGPFLGFRPDLLGRNGGDRDPAPGLHLVEVRPTRDGVDSGAYDPRGQVRQLGKILHHDVVLGVPFALSPRDMGRRQERLPMRFAAVHQRRPELDPGHLLLVARNVGLGVLFIACLDHPRLDLAVCGVNFVTGRRFFNSLSSRVAGTIVPGSFEVSGAITFPSASGRLVRPETS